MTASRYAVELHAKHENPSFSDKATVPVSQSIHRHKFCEAPAFEAHSAFSSFCNRFSTASIKARWNGDSAIVIPPFCFALLCYESQFFIEKRQTFSFIIFLHLFFDFLSLFLSDCTFILLGWLLSESYFLWRLKNCFSYFLDIIFRICNNIDINCR